MDKPKAAGRRLVIGAVLVLMIALDQWTKALAVQVLKGRPPYVLFEGIFEFLYVENQGAAFGMMNGMRLLFLLLAPSVSLFLLWILHRLPPDGHFLPARACLVAVIAGALGNFIDRLRQGYVVDFIYFKPIDFPVFNVADIYVTCGAFLLAALMIFYYKEEDLKVLPF